MENIETHDKKIKSQLRALGILIRAQLYKN